MLQSMTQGQAGGPALKLVLVRNQEDRPRYATLVSYETRWVPVDDNSEALRLVPVRRTYGLDERGAPFCTRVTELRWGELKPAAPYREFMEQWVGHVKEQLALVKKGARPAKVEVVP